MPSTAKRRSVEGLVHRKNVFGNLGAINFLIEREARKASSPAYSDEINIVFISDEGYVMPTSVAIYSLRESKSRTSRYRVFVVGKGLSAHSKKLLTSLEVTDFRVEIIEPEFDFEAEEFSQNNSHILSATRAALYKFALADILPELDRLIYLDGDLIVKDDLKSLYYWDLKGAPLGAVADSGQIYYRHNYVKKVEKYFNTGVLVIDCRAFRMGGYTDKLIHKKKELSDSLLMDQDVFNVVFDRNWCGISIRYNLLYVNLLRAKGKYSMEQINALYGTEYVDLECLLEDSVIVHYSSKDKPWKAKSVPQGKLWYAAQQELELSKKILSGEPVDVSVVVPIYNSGLYLADCLESVLTQGGCRIEVICVIDGSSDDSWRIAESFKKRFHNVIVCYQDNQGQSSARNLGLSFARGKYVYFMDSDDLLKARALDICVQRADADNLDVLYFDAETIYESDELREEYQHYDKYYRAKAVYPYVMEGVEAFGKLVSNGDYRPAPVLKLIRRGLLNERKIGFKNGIIHEDNLFTLKVILSADRVAKIAEVLYTRRVRQGSTMTSKDFLRSLMGYMSCFIEMLRIVESVKLTDTASDAVFRQISGMLRSAKRNSEQITLEMLNDPDLHSAQKIFFKTLGLISLKS